EARANAGKHIPHNITLACSLCNRLKDDLGQEDLETVFRSPKTFKEQHPGYAAKTLAQLEDFALIALARYKGHSWMIEELGFTSQNWRANWEQLRLGFRSRWLKKTD